MSDLHRFYDQVDQLKNIIKTILEFYDKKTELNELDHYYEKFIMVKKINMRKPVELFYTNGVVPYINEITTSNDTFFLKEAERKINEDVDVIELKQEELSILEHIKCVWSLIDQEKKQAIWKYVKTICVLSERVSGGNVLINTIKNS